MVVGDSFLIISQDRHQREIMDQIAGHLHKCIIDLLRQILDIQFSHIQREHNAIVDKLANQASSLDRGTIKKIGVHPHLLGSLSGLSSNPNSNQVHESVTSKH